MKNKIIFEFTTHAKYQMAMRRISQKTVEFVVLNADKVAPDISNKSLLVAVKELDDGGVIKVWYRFKDGEAVVLSCLIITVRREIEKTFTQKQKRKSKGKR